MKLSFCVFYLFLLLDLGHSCAKSPPAPEIRTEFVKKVDPGTFSERYYQTEPACMNVRFTPDKETTKELKNPQCETMVPGLSTLEHGVIELFTGNINQYEKVLSLTCDTDKHNVKYRDYTVPAEVELYRTKQIESNGKIFSIQSITEDLEKDVQLREADHQYLLKLPLLRSDVESIKSAVYLGLSVYVYNAEIRENIRPNEDVMREYEKLPESWSSDVNAYFKFIMRFGTHIRSSTMFGGRVMVLVSDAVWKKNLEHINFDDNTVKELIDQFFSGPFEDIDRGPDTKVSVLSYGGYWLFEELWKNHIPEASGPLDATLIPLNKLLDSSNSNKSQSLGHFITFENDHQNYEKYSYLLRITNSTNKLAEFVNLMIQKQLQNICSSNYLNSIIKYGIERENNIRLNKFFLKCSTNDTEYDMLKNTNYMYEYTIHLIPYVCFTVQERIKACVEPDFNVPENVNCVQFFEKGNCDGNGITIDDMRDIHDLFSNRTIMSIALCDPV